MKLIDRAKNIIITPKTEWEVIAGETTSQAEIITQYVLPLAGVAAVASFIGTSLVGYSLGPLGSYRMPIGTGITVLVLQLVMAVVSVFVVAAVIKALAPTFNAERDFDRAFKVAAYSFTPAWVAGILMILPMLGILAILGAIYGIYLMYLGLPRLMRNPEDKSAGYTALVVVAAIVVQVIISIIIGAISAPRLAGLGQTRQEAIERLAEPGTTQKLDQFAKKMEEAGRKMEEAQKSGDPQKQMEAALGALGTAMSGGKGVDPVQLDKLKPFVPESFAGMPRTESRSERSGVSGFTVAKAEGVYAQEGKRVELEVVDTGGAAGLMGLAGWIGVTGERENDERIERTRKEGTRVVNEEVSKRGGTNKYSVVLADRFVVSAEGTGVDINALKGAVASLDLARLESLK
jgi:hypothetical protein